jgi:predicted nucleic acid-binding protein
MTAVFADTSFYLALLGASDVHHAEAARLSRDLRRRVVVTEFVLLELANALSDSRTRQVFVGLLSQVRSDPNVLIVPVSAELFDAGRDLYGQRPDKNWSLTDCTSFVVMSQQGLHDALTADRHFEQAGFNVLLKQIPRRS